MPQLLKHISLASFFGLMITLIIWITFGKHSDTYPVFAFLLIALVPLLFPLRGLLHGKPYTHAWTTFLMLLYFSHGVGELYSAEGFNIYPALEIVFSFTCFVASILFIKYNAKAKSNT